MSSRGRGYPRSGRGGGYFRGSSNSYRGSSRGSGGFTTPRGGGGSNRYTSSSYDSRSSSRYLPSDERFPSNRSSDSYKRVSDYRGPSSRDRSPPERKRSRYDQGSSRSHEYGGSSGDYSSSRNYESTYEHKRDTRNGRAPQSPSTNSRSSFRQTSSSSRRSPERMGPPKRIPPRSARGVSYRGRISTRGLRTSRVLIRRSDLRTVQRKRNIPSLKSRDYLRSLKLARLRSSIKKKRSLERRSSEDRKERKREGGDEDDGAKDGEKKKSSVSSKKKETTEKEASEKDDLKSVEDSAEKSTTSPTTSKKTSTKSVKKDKDTAEGDDNVDKEEVASGDESNNESPSDNEKVEKKTKSDTRDFPSKNYGKSFIKLTCVHCFEKCLTFKEYSQHLHDKSHKMMMTKLYMKQKTKLARMRQRQRNNQREIEEKGDNKSRPQFCPLCCLNYRQPKSKHQLSVGHRSMKKFLTPHCRICNITFKGPMIYEAHRCSLEHIKKKALAESRKENQDSGDDEKELDLKNFMTVDSVGDVDGNDDNDDANDDPNEKKEEINVGSEHVKKVESYYCDLCRYHLPRQDDYETALHRHCSSSNHLRAYLQYREDKQLRKAAEKVHRKHLEAKDTKDKDKNEVKKSTENSTEVVATADDSETDDVEEKMWASVDQDLGDLLREVEPENGNTNNNDDDEDEGSTANAERYDRFKNSEMKKNKSDEIIKDEIMEVIDETPKEEKSEIVESK